MKFTDKHLKQLKNELSDCDRYDYGVELETDQAKALLVRLEAAEAVASYSDNAPFTLIEQWKKAAGK